MKLKQITWSVGLFGNLKGSIGNTQVGAVWREGSTWVCNSSFGLRPKSNSFATEQLAKDMVRAMTLYFIRQLADTTPEPSSGQDTHQAES